MDSKFLKNKKCLFIGNDNCDYSRECLNFLKSRCSNVVTVYSKFRGEKPNYTLETWNGDFIFSFKNYCILKSKIIESARYMAINFHPGTPDYPGSGSYNWAIYHGADKFGVTVHLIDEKIDHGKILDVFKFPTGSISDPATLKSTCDVFSVQVFKDIINKIDILGQDWIDNKTCFEDHDHKWKRPARSIKDLDKMREITPYMNREELLSRIYSFHSEKFPLFTQINGFQFFLKID